MDHNTLLLIHFVSTAVMTGLIWVVQLVHYPSFYFIEDKKFINFEKFHKNRISLIVLPFMVLEVLTGVMLIYLHEETYSRANFISGLIILLIIWIVTFGFSMRMHQKLEKGMDTKAIHLLIATNWIRTIGWSLRLALLILFSKISIS